MILEIKGLKKHFKDVKAVDGIDFGVKEGEIFGLLGPNGAGKSTTISMLSTLIKPDRGLILYKNENIINNPKAIQRELGFVPQEIALYPTLSGLDNLKFWGKIYGLKGKELKKRINEISEIIGITDRLKNRVEKYSGGMKRRLNIGAALLHEPQIIILDEPTVGIDPQSRNHILNSVKEINKRGSTVIYTTHYMEEAENLCDTICIMDKGKIIASGTKEELLDVIKASDRIELKIDKMSNSLIEKMNKLEFIENIKCDNNEIVFDWKGINGNYTKMMEILAEEKCSLLSMDVKKPDLEYVFLNLTGRELRD